MANYEEAIAEAPAWQSALESKLKEESTPDKIYIPYKQIAQAFPFKQAHSGAFEINVIDDKALKKWVKERGWDADQEKGQFGEIVFKRVRK